MTLYLRRSAILAVLGLVVVGVAAVWAIPLLSGDSHSTPDVSKDGFLRVEPRSLTVKSDPESPDEPQVVRIQLTNDGNQAIQITEVSTTCGCTMAESLSNRRLVPGATFELPVKVAVPPYGERQSRLTLRTNSVRSPAVAVAFRLVGKELEVPFLTLSPRDLRIEGTNVGARDGRPLTIRTMERKGSDQWLLWLEPSSPEVSAVLAELREEAGMTEDTVARVYRFLVDAPVPSSEDMTYTFTLTPVTRELAQKPIHAIHIASTWRPAIRSIPRELYVSFAKDAQSPVGRQLAFVVAEPQQRTEFSVEPGQFEHIEIGPIQYLDSDSPIVARLALRFHPAAGRNDAESVASRILRVQTNDPRRPLIEIPIRMRMISQ